MRNKQKKMCIDLSFNNFFKSIFSFLPPELQLSIKKNLELVKRLDYEKKNIYLHIDSYTEYKYRLRSCFHEPKTVKWIEGFLQEEEVMFDVGANVGAYSLIAAKQNNGSNIICSFEPNFSSYYKLCKNVILNECAKTIFPFQIALSDYYSIADLSYSSFEVGSAFHTLEDKTFFKKEPKHRQKVITYPMDQFIRDFNIPQPNHVKIDVDGLEFKIIKGATKALSSTNCRSLNVEIDENAKSYKAMIKHIKSLGFVFYEKYTDPNADDPEPNDFKIYNYIFVKKHDSL